MFARREFDVGNVCSWQTSVIYRTGLLSPFGNVLEVTKLKKDTVWTCGERDWDLVVVLLSCGSRVLQKSINLTPEYSAALYQPVITLREHITRLWCAFPSWHNEPRASVTENAIVVSAALHYGFTGVLISASIIINTYIYGIFLKTIYLYRITYSTYKNMLCLYLFCCLFSQDTSNKFR